jgi:HEPN domain-containing protein
MQLRDSNKWDGQPRLLTDEETADPMRVVYELFDYAHLPDLRNTLWEWLKTTVSGNYNKPSLHYKDRESLLAFYEKLQRLLEASHLLLVTHRLQKTKRKPEPTPSLPADDISPKPVLAPETELAPLIDKLVGLFSPQFLFDMGKIQEPLSDQPVYHFLLVLPNTATCTYAACQSLAEQACPEMGTIQLLTVKKNELKRQLAEGHLLYASLCTRERLVYAQASQLIPPINTSALPLLLAKAQVDLDAILYKADAFYQGALFFLQQHHKDLAVFHFQQAIEHCLRGFLLAVTGRNHVSHDLLSLRRQALPFFPQLVQLLPVEKDSALCLLHQVSKAYVQSRYENDFSLPVTDIQQLKKWVENLLPQTKATYGQHVVSLSILFHLPVI